MINLQTCFYVRFRSFLHGFMHGFCSLSYVPILHIYQLYERLRGTGGPAPTLWSNSETGDVPPRSEESGNVDGI